MTALPAVRRSFTPEEYLLVERNACYRSEFLDGEIYAMAGATKAHNTIVDNLTIEIGIRLKGTPCQGMSQDMKVDTREARLYSYPDYLVVCGEQHYLDAHEDVLMNPLVIIEVLSPSTENYDRTTKFDRYQRIETLREVVFVAQNSPRIEHFVRHEDGNWEHKIVMGMDASLKFAAVDVSVSLVDIYDRIVFPANPA